MTVEDLFDEMLRLMNSGQRDAKVFAYEGEAVGIAIRRDDREIDFFETGPA
jgi:hypothetical protein